MEGEICKVIGCCERNAVDRDRRRMQSGIATKRTRNTMPPIPTSTKITTSVQIALFQIVTLSGLYSV